MRIVRIVPKECALSVLVPVVQRLDDVDPPGKNQYPVLTNELRYQLDSDLYGG